MPQLDFDGANSKISADKIQGQSGTTVTIPAGHNLAGDGSGLTSLSAANLTGTVATARLGSGTANSTTFLRGDQTYAAAGGGKVLQVVYHSTTAVNQATTGTAEVNVLQSVGVDWEPTITLSSTSSKVLMMMQAHYIVSNSVTSGVSLGRMKINPYYKIGAGAYSLAINSGGMFHGGQGDSGDQIDAKGGYITLTNLLSPGSISELTFSLRYACVDAGQSQRVEINPDAASATNITLLEIG